MADGRWTEGLPFGLRDPLGKEALDLLPVFRQDAQRPVPGVGDVDRQLHDPLQDGVEVQLRRERQPRFDQQLVPCVLPRHRGGSLA